MVRVIAMMLVGLIALAGCDAPSSNSSGNANARSKIYRIKPGETGKLQYRMLDSVNALRSAKGVAPVELNAQLTAAAATHSKDMSLQNRPWHFGSDASSPIDRVQRVGYTGMLVGENIAETYESELEVLAAWIEQKDTKRVLMSKAAKDMGFAWFQERNGKIWWTLIMGNPENAPIIPEANPDASRLVPVPAVAQATLDDESAQADVEAALEQAENSNESE